MPPAPSLLNGKPVRFDVAFSFAGAHRKKVRDIATIVSNHIDPNIKGRDKGRVFFDEWFTHEILGSNMRILLQRFYLEKSLLVVADLSKDYSDREWCQAENEAIDALRMSIDSARDETARLRFLPVRFGPGETPGIYCNTGWLDGETRDAQHIANEIIKRLLLLKERLEPPESPASQLRPEDPEDTSDYTPVEVARDRINRDITAAIAPPPTSLWRSLLQKVAPPPTSTCVIFGPSGFGKTTLARRLYNSWPEHRRTWIDADRPTIASPPRQHSHLIVIDRLDAANKSWLKRNQWLASCRSQVVLVTSHDTIRDSALQVRPQTRFRVVEVGGFSTAEASEFLKCRLLTTKARTLNSDAIQSVNRTLSGCPLAWQLLVDIINARDGDCFELFSSLDAGAILDSKLFDRVFGAWFEQLPSTGPLASQLLVALACVSVIGTNAHALSYITNQDELQVRQSLLPLVAKGLVCSRDDGSLIPHAMLRSACNRMMSTLACGAATGEKRESCADMTARMASRYSDYLNQSIAGEHIEPRHLLSTIDAWLVALTRAFDNADNSTERFVKRYTSAMESIGPLLKRRAVSAPHVEWLSAIMRDESARLDCSAVIGIAQVVRRIQPRSALLAAIVWELTDPSAEHHDEWALVEIASAGALHFADQGTEVADAGFERALRVFQHMGRAIEAECEYFDIGVDGSRKGPQCAPERGDNGVTYRVFGACIAGISCLLKGRSGNRYWANPSIAARFPNAILAAILFWDERGEAALAQEIVNSYWPFIPTRDESLLAALYLRGRGLHVPRFHHHNTLQSDSLMVHPMIAGLVGRMAYAETFRSFLDTYDKNKTAANPLGLIRLSPEDI